MFEIKEIMDYAHSVRRRFAEKMATLPWEEVTADREASHHSMKNILVHMVDNEDWIVDAHIVGNKTHSRKKPEEFPDMRSISDFMDRVQSRTDGLLATVEEDDLRKPVTVIFGSGSGPGITMTAEEWLMQSFTEQVFHLGEIEALMWQKDIEPPRMQWFANNPRANAQAAAGGGHPL